MDAHISLGAALAIGFFTGVHCLGMCGGLVSAATMNIQTPQQKSLLQQRWIIHLSYNLGRISSYGIAGAAAGVLGQALLDMSISNEVQTLLQYISAIMLILLGIYLSGVANTIGWTEPVGKVLWKFISPLAQRFIPFDTVKKGFAAGLLWGWIPCGPVYAMLVPAIATGDAFMGAAIMLVFGLGTLPNLMAMGIVAHKLLAFMRNHFFKISIALIMILYGCWRLYMISTHDVRMHANKHGAGMHQQNHGEMQAPKMDQHSKH